MFGFGVLFLLLAGASISSEQVTLAWDANPEPDVIGYRLHYGTARGQYTQSVDAGNTVTFTLANLSSETTYYAIVTAYNSAGLESLPSNEIAFETGLTATLVNLSPIVSLSVSSSPSQFGNLPFFVLNATATDPDGTIDRIEFYNGTEKLGEQTASPWFFFWAEFGAGSFSLTAIAYDDAGASTQSLPVDVAVTPDQLQDKPITPPSAAPSPGIHLVPIKTDLGDGGNDSLLILVSGEEGQVVKVLHSDDLKNWFPLAILPITGSFDYLIDPGSLVETKRRFYRLVVDD